MRTQVIGYEGKLTSDFRYIFPNALTFPTSPIPIIKPEGSDVAGFAENFQRLPDGAIQCEINIDPAMDDIHHDFAMFLGDLLWTMHGTVMEVHSARILDLTIIPMGLLQKRIWDTNEHKEVRPSGE